MPNQDEFIYNSVGSQLTDGYDVDARFRSDLLVVEESDDMQVQVLQPSDHQSPADSAFVYLQQIAVFVRYMVNAD